MSDESIVNEILEKKKEKPIQYDFNTEKKRFYSPWDKCNFLSSVGDWVNNRRRVDDAGYVPLDKQIKRMIADGERLLDFKHSPQYRAIYEELAKADEQIPQDDMLFMSRSDLLAEAHRLRDELTTIQMNRPQEAPQSAEKNPPSAETKETVSTPASAGSSE